jgi:hypothetical protein
MGRLLVRDQVHFDRAEQHPFAIRRRHRLAHTLQRHHVVESEWTFSLRKSRHYSKNCKDQEGHTAHTFLREQTQ